MNPPSDISKEAFEKIAAQAWNQVPEKFLGHIENVALLIEDEPSKEVRTQENLGPHETLLGLYHGIPESARGEGYGVGVTLPDTITLYRLPILDEAEEFLAQGRSKSFPEAVEEAVRETLWHEIGHYFGLEEGQIRVREHRGTNRFKA